MDTEEVKDTIRQYDIYGNTIPPKILQQRKDCMRRYVDTKLKRICPDCHNALQDDDFRVYCEKCRKVRHAKNNARKKLYKKLGRCTCCSATLTEYDGGKATCLNCRSQNKTPKWRTKYENYTKTC